MLTDVDPKARLRFDVLNIPVQGKTHAPTFLRVLKY